MKESGIYSYLEKSGVLETGTPEEIAACRKEYWSMVKREWMRHKRSQETEFKVYFSAAELKVITVGAKRYKLSKTRYIQQAALADAKQERLLPNIEILTHVRQLLELLYASIQELSEAGELTPEIEDTLRKTVAHIEHEIHNTINRS